MGANMLRAKAFATAAVLTSWLTGTAPAQVPYYSAGAAQPHAAVSHTEGDPSSMWSCNDLCSSRSCRPGLHNCPVVCLRPWKCEDLELKLFECPPSYCGCKGFLWCPPAEEKNGNGDCNGEKKDCNGDKPAEEPEKNGACPEEAKEEEIKTPLMQIIQCWHPGLYSHMECKGTKLYGWIQGGYTANFDSPNSRFNFGPTFNVRSNDFQLNQVYFVLENPLEHDKGYNWGYRIDTLVGTDAPFVVSNGLFDKVVPPADRGDRIGVDLPQFFVEAHLPGVITEKGMDVKVGRWYTLHVNEVVPAAQTNFYSHSYAFFNLPFTHTGLLTTLHLTDTIDVMNGVVRGWDQAFDDNNDGVTYHGMVMWNACDKRQTFYVTSTVGPEQTDNTGNMRTLVTADYIRKFGAYNQWEMQLEGFHLWDANAVVDGTDARAYGGHGKLFYIVDPRLILGLRAEVFSDIDGIRTGFADTFYEVTTGITYRPYQNLRMRPELRFDWADSTRPFNDGTDKFQTTAAVDVIWEF
jgi:hypothetical protein